MKKNFRDRVLSVVAKIPKGHVMSYKEVARRAGNPQAYRAVGYFMMKNCDQKVPCHRVIGSAGHLVGYRRGLRVKAGKLRREGIRISKHNRVIR